MHIIQYEHVNNVLEIIIFKIQECKYNVLSPIWTKQFILHNKFIYSCSSAAITLLSNYLKKKWYLKSNQIKKEANKTNIIQQRKIM